MENELIKEFEKQRDERLLSAPAKHIMEKLKPLSSHVEMYQKRWFWELLQNACDFNQNVKIQVEINDQFLFFRHNGRAFSISDAMNLIFPDSGKDTIKEPNVIGQFGTGFISTHILSSKIRISGILEDKLQGKYPFTFNLNRSDYLDKTRLAASLSKSEKELWAAKKDIIDLNKEYQTEIAYERSSTFDFTNFDDTIKNGIVFVKEALPYVFAFIPQLDRVEIKTEERTEIFSRFKNGEFGCVYESLGDSNIKYNLIIHKIKEGDTEVAIAVKDGFINMNKTIPILFCGYPMLGTEKFPFPCIVNNSQFIPKSEREGIELSENDLNNRFILEEAVLAYSKLLEELCNKEVKKIYNVCNLKNGNIETKDQDWFKGNVGDNLKDYILESKVIETIKGRKKLSEVFVPYPESEESFDAFYSICEETNLPIPIKEESFNWYNTLNFLNFKNQKLDLK